ncbi:hypothetical protein G3814_003915 [Escherichia coli]|nr:hypothetical protein [Escherichia coli]
MLLNWQGRHFMEINHSRITSYETFCAGSLNPVSATAIEIETSRGSSLN